MSDEDSETENGGYSISNNGYRHSGDSEDVHMDEEELRQANQDVMQMQQQMMDRESRFLYTDLAYLLISGSRRPQTRMDSWNSYQRPLLDSAIYRLLSHPS